MESATAMNAIRRASIIATLMLGACGLHRRVGAGRPRTQGPLQPSDRSNSSSSIPASSSSTSFDAPLRRGKPAPSWPDGIWRKPPTNYSERGQPDVDSLHALITINVVAPTDGAYLGDAPTILLIPVG